MARRKKQDDSMLTDLELRVMGCLWERGPSTAREVQRFFEKSEAEPFAYTTVSTVLRVLESKSVIESRPQGRAHVYSPILKQSQYQGQAVNKMVSELFSGKKAELVKSLVASSELSASELEEIKSLIDRTEFD